MKNLLSPIRIAGLLLLSVGILYPAITMSSLRLDRLSANLVLIFAVLGVNLITGRGGLISLGHGVFFAIGAFAMAKFIDVGVPLLFSGVFATIVAGLFGVVLGLPALRVRGPFLALITFAIALAFQPLARKLPNLTGGVAGLRADTSGFAPPAFLGIDDHAHLWRYGWCLVVAGIWFILMRNFNESRVGRALKATADNDLAASSFGVNVRVVRITALAVSGAVAGTGGALYAMVHPFLIQTEFGAILSFSIYAAAIVGGVGSIGGSILGVLVLLSVPQVSSSVGLGENESIVLGAALIIITFLAPNGLWGLFSRLDRKFRRSQRVLDT